MEDIAYAANISQVFSQRNLDKPIQNIYSSLQYILEITHEQTQQIIIF